MPLQRKHDTYGNNFKSLVLVTAAIPVYEHELLSGAISCVTLLQFRYVTSTYLISILHLIDDKMTVTGVRL